MSTSPRLYDRFPRYRDSSASPRQGAVRANSEYDLDDLPPSPDAGDGLLRGASPSSHAPPSRSPHGHPGRHGDAEDGLDAMFRGPPPPITESMLILPRKSGKASPPRPSGRSSRGSFAAAGSSPSTAAGLGMNNIKSVLFSSPPRQVQECQPDSVWRSLMRRESALQAELQQLLDVQALGLVSGRESAYPDTADVDSTADGSAPGSEGSTTPTGTFYSAATSRSQMIASINLPARSTARGDVIPVRQPPPAKPPGLRSARRGLANSIAALARLKAEEDGHLSSALAERKVALAKLGTLTGRREHIAGELAALEEDDEEPLGAELREMQRQKGELEVQIRELEERLVGMRSRARQLDARIDDVRNKREAGLSGYRGALQDVDKELDSILRRPPIKPLDPELVKQTAFPGSPEDSSPALLSTGGSETLHLKPDRRTPGMIRSWWEAEVDVLEKRKDAVCRDKEALEAGADMWREVTETATSFERELRQIASAAASGDANADFAETMQDQLQKMGAVIEVLERNSAIAEEKGWNLLICAVGAEREAFTEAARVLRADLGLESEDSGRQTPVQPSQGSLLLGGHDRDSDRGSDGPPDLPTAAHGKRSFSSPPPPARTDSENEVPPEFLTEFPTTIRGGRAGG